MISGYDSWKLATPPEYSWDEYEAYERDRERAEAEAELEDERAEAEARQRDLAETEVCDGR